MDIGKLSGRILKRSVLRQFHNDDDGKAAKSAGVGNDCAFLYGVGDVAVNTQTVCFGGSRQGYYAVMHAVNHLAAAGAVPLAAEDTLLFPEGTEEEEVKAAAVQVNETCRSCGVKVIGGHTEISRDVKAAVISVTGFGQTDRSFSTDKALMRPGQEIVMSKWIGLEGTAVLADIRNKRLKERYPSKMIDVAAGFGGLISVLPEAAGAIKSGVCAMHAASQGGIFGALWEMAEAAGTGLEIDFKQIPVKQETVEICEELDLNPYRLLSGGALLMAADDGAELVRELGAEGIPATVIGCATDSNDRVLVTEGGRRFLEPVNPEELFRIR